jgi:hypothetical protein
MGRDCASERVPIALAEGRPRRWACVGCCGAPAEGLWEGGGRLASPMAGRVPGEGRSTVLSLRRPSGDGFC